MYMCLRKDFLGIKIKCLVCLVDINKISSVCKRRQGRLVDIHEMSYICTRQVGLIDIHKIVDIYIFERVGFGNIKYISRLVDIHTISSVCKRRQRRLIDTHEMSHIYTKHVVLVDTHKIVYISLRKVRFGKTKHNLYVVDIHKISYVCKSRQVRLIDKHIISYMYRRQARVSLTYIRYCICVFARVFFESKKMSHVCRGHT